MELGFLDHLLAILLIVILPLKGIRDYDRLLARLQSDEPGARLHIYRRTLVWEWGLVAVLLVTWWAADRTLLQLGLGWEWGVLPLIGWGAAAVIVILLGLQTRMILHKPSGMDSFRQEIGSLRALIPRDAREAQTWVWLSWTAGICEELLFRGFLMAYFNHLVGIWGAVALSSLVFGLGHAYQGGRGILKISGVGLMMAGLFVLTDGLWAPILVHAIIDLNSGYLGRRALEGWENEEPVGAPVETQSPAI